MAFEASLCPVTDFLSQSTLNDDIENKAIASGTISTNRMPGSYFDDNRTELGDEDVQTRAYTSSISSNEDIISRSTAYNDRVESQRVAEYPQLVNGTLYLDHAGTTIPSRLLTTSFAELCLNDIYGNPHSGSAGAASQRSCQMVENVRLEVLRWFKASPDDFDIVFISNTTAGIKLIADGVRGWQKSQLSTHPQTSGLGEISTTQQRSTTSWLGYHAESHTSIVGLREEFNLSKCFAGDEDVENWLKRYTKLSEETGSFINILAYPAQSNMSGRKLPLHWLAAARSLDIFTLLDAAAFVSTSQLDLSDTSNTADFTVLSFYKIFGMPNLGALLVKKSAGKILAAKEYFGGGTVEMVSVMREQWKIRKSTSLHDTLEDGTLPVHSIAMLGCAFRAHETLFKDMKHIEMHTKWLSRKLYWHLFNLRHWNESRVCIIYGNHSRENFGPIVAFNIKNSKGQWLSNFEVEKLAAARHIQIRIGSVCNPGGIANALDLSPWDLKANFSAGQRCGSDNDVFDGRPTGVIRVSLGAMSTLSDVDNFVKFMKDFFVDRLISPTADLDRLHFLRSPQASGIDFRISSLIVYPIKSCAGWSIPDWKPWPLRQEGLAWDREWCLVHKGSRSALSQKRHSRMALLSPRIDLDKGLLFIDYVGPSPLRSNIPSSISIPLSLNPSVYADGSPTCFESKVCGENVPMNVYAAKYVNDFFSSILDTPCELARICSLSSGIHSSRHVKPHLSKNSSYNDRSISLLFSNESPILVILQASINRLNDEIRSKDPHGTPVPASVFRANIVISERNINLASGTDHPYIEDFLSALKIVPGRTQAEDSDTSVYAKCDDNASSAYELDILGPCSRCQMVCIDQSTGEKTPTGEPFTTLATTRRKKGGKIHFGVHATLGNALSEGMLQVGDHVEAIFKNEYGQV